MARRAQLDAARRSGARWLIVLALAGAFAFSCPAQTSQSDSDRTASARAAFNEGKWEDAAKIAQGSSAQPAELDFLAGLALAKLQRWDAARVAFESAHRKVPGDARFLIELAGVNYKQRDIQDAKHNLQAALILNPKDSYAQEFLGTLYFLEGNLEAALKYWNPIEKPRLRSVAVQPPGRLNQAILEHAIGFNPPQVLTQSAFLAAEARLAALEVYPRRRFELVPAPEGTYDATFHMPERDGWGDSPIEGALSLLSGVPYATVYPAFYDLWHRDMNVTSLLRWDSEKRREYAALAMPLFNDPAIRVRFYFDARNENWNLSNTFFGGGTPLTDLNVRRFAGGAEFLAVANGRWSWSTGVEVTSRAFRSLAGLASARDGKFFVNGRTLDYWVRAERSILRMPERRVMIDSAAETHLGRNFAEGAGVFGTLRGSVKAQWFPRPKGDDYEMQAQLRAGDTLGQVPLDELFELGIERDDNDLWLRGHDATSGGRKGAAPLGRRFFLANWEVDKNVYGNGLFTVKLGPFLDNGTIADPSGLFGSRQWLWDTGAQCKIRVLGTVAVLLIYGRDLRGGRNVFYGTAAH